MNAKLIVVGGKATKGSIALKLPTVIGRGRDAGLKIGHPMISRRHAELFESEGLLMVRDLGSLNGTTIDGRRVKESPLPPEAEFTVGPLTFRAQYEYEGDLSALPAVAFDESEVPSPPGEPWSESPEFEALADNPADETALEKEPVEETPIVDTAVAEESVAEESVEEGSVEEGSVEEELIAEEPAEEFSLDDLFAEEPNTAEPEEMNPVEEEQVAEAPVEANPVAEEPAKDALVDEELIEEKEEPVAEEPAHDTLVDEEVLFGDEPDEENPAEKSTGDSFDDFLKDILG